MTKTTKPKKPLKEEFAKFYENPTREGLRDLLANNLGEFPYLDFKEKLPSLSKVARHLLGLANLGGGCLVIGVAEKDDKTLESKGLDELIDKKNILDGINKFFPNTLFQDIDILDFAYEASEYRNLVGKKFQAILVSGDPKHLPFVTMAAGDGIRKNAIYVRRGTSTEEANYDELQSIINRRIETGYSSQSEIDLRTHIEELKTLYSYIERGKVGLKHPFINNVEALMNKNFDDLKFYPNPNYPKEDFEEFISSSIEKKKVRIMVNLNIADL